MRSRRLRLIAGAWSLGATAACALLAAPAGADLQGGYPFVPHGSTESQLGATAASDFDSDGAADLLLLGGGSLAVALGDGKGGLGRAESRGPKRVDDVVLADFDEDGLLDLATAAADGTGTDITVSRNLGDGRFGRVAGASLTAGDFPYPDVDAGDFDGDGDTDIAVRGPDSVANLRWEAGALLPAVVTEVADPGPQSLTLVRSGPLAAGDLNTDGLTDLVVELQRSDSSANSVVSLTGRPDGTFDARVTSPGSGGSNGFSLTDLDGDGRLDLIGSGSSLAASHANVIVRHGTGDGGFEGPVETLSRPFGYLPPAFADVDRDGDTDIAALRADGRADVFEQRGPRSFSPAVEKAKVETPATGLASGDFNGDGWPDVAVSRAGRAEIQLNSLSPTVGPERGRFAIRLRDASLPGSLRRLGPSTEVIGTCSVECAARVTIRVPAAVKRRAGMRSPILASTATRWQPRRENSTTLRFRGRAVRSLARYDGGRVRILILARGRALTHTRDGSAARGTDRVAIRLGVGGH